MVLFILFKLENSHVEIVAPEEAFFKVVDRGFSQVITILNSFDSCDGFFQINPQTKREAKWMIEAYCELAINNQPLPKWLTNYFYQALEKILGGDPAENALGLVSLPHRPKQSQKKERDRKIHEDVTALMQKGLPLYDAALEASDKYKMHESTIQNIYSVVKRMIEIELTFQKAEDLPF